jgi:cytidylate kinase
MPIVLISSPPHGMGRILARNLADKTGWPFFSRDQLVEEAHKQGVRLSRLETSIVKSQVKNESLALEKEIFLSFLTDMICKKAVHGNLVYSGRAAHLIMPGISHLIRVGVNTPRETRIQNVVKELNLSPEKALDYLNTLNQDIRRWVKYVHREEYNDPSYFDLFLNLETMSLDNASKLLNKAAEFSDFKPSPESIERLEDLHLAARARLHLARNKETAGLHLGVRARNKVVTVTYMPRQEAAAAAISRVMETLEGCRESLCTMAETNILYIQEAFDPSSDHFNRVTQLAKRWGAAVELLRLIPKQETGLSNIEPEKEASRSGREANGYTGGVEDDEPEMPADDGGLTRTLDELIAMGRSAGGFTVAGDKKEVVDAVKEKNNYSLVILGDLFSAKGHSAATRLTREMGLSIHEKFKVPVISISELASEFLFGKQQAFKLLLSVLVTVGLYSAVFQFQRPILDFMGGDLHHQWKWTASICVALFVPLVAYAYGTVAGLILKLIDID